MPDLVVVVPSRGRPDAAVALAEAVAGTRRADTALVVVVDDDDPAAGDYDLSRWDFATVTRFPNTRRGCVLALNAVACELARTVRAVGFLGDDHRPRTRGWDRVYLDALDALGTGIVYGDDGHRGQGLPTHVAMTSDIVLALGWMAPPVLRHLFADDFWRDLGVAAGCLRYLPGVLVEHLHPAAGKGVMDDGYAVTSCSTMFALDKGAYWSFRRDGGLDQAVRAVVGLRGGSA
jgi:hypothetical protein